ncbi:hypothetical protein [Streptomyces auratus]|uniref:Uncharacterized protein n=1 Tax=Streptomyces auratus AGR0001 TaxID=1160718 RepID=J2JSK1_9ACTN|nr:hypothetical protein [Streptomyces auratus]QTZ90879.1 hypothetical protein SU9_004890 [Streptomyces auratus AGR0001]
MDLLERLARWRTFADDCLDGYPWEVEEFLMDVNSRSTLQELMAASREDRAVDHHLIAAELDAIDTTLRTIFDVEAFPKMPPSEWWLRCVPSYAARDFCREFKGAYGVSIAARSKFDLDVDAMVQLSANGMAPADICLKVAEEQWYVTKRPALLFRACRRSLPMDRSARRALWAWATGNVSAPGLRAALGE